MHHINRNDWLKTPDGAARGYIQPQRLSELWFHIGTNCNLRCPFCLEGSKPGDNRLNLISFDDAKPFMDEALGLGVEKFSFTGGEPFINSDMVRILDYALDLRPCLVLTNATEPLSNRLGEVMPLRDKPNAVSFRVSIDYPDAARHDAGRGRGNFRKSLKTMAYLAQNGFNVSVARLRETDQDIGEGDAAYRPVFADAGLPEDTLIISFPDFLTPDSVADVPDITEDCMTRHMSADQRDEMMCNFSKMVVKQHGRMRTYACTLVDDDPDYDLGGTLAEAQEVTVMMKHHRCYSCFAYGASCSES